MTQGFSWHRRSRTCAATFSAFEADLLRSLAGQLIELLRNESAIPTVSTGEDDELEAMLDFSGPTAEPDDPVLARLFPTAYPEDEEAAGDFRRFTEAGLRQGKADAAGSVIETLEAAGLSETPQDGLFIDVELGAPAARSWLGAFTDMRLAIGTRLEVGEDDEEYWESLPEDDPRGPVHEIYMWLAFLQETLVHSISR